MKKKTASTNGIPELLFAEEVAPRLRMSPYTFKRYYRQGHIRAYLVDKAGRPRFLLAQVLEDFEKFG